MSNPAWRQRVSAQLTNAWVHGGWLSWGLRPFSVLFRLALLLRHRPAAASCGLPVAVVGNVWAGGTGKTPTVIALVKRAQARGVRVGVVSRGHGRAVQAIHLLGPGSQADEAGDEPLEIYRATQSPVCVGADRLAAIATLRQAHPELQLIVSDDGMQHARMARDLTLALFDERGLGNGHCLPAGPLRHPWATAWLPDSPTWVVQAHVNTAPDWVAPGVALAGLPLFHAQRSLCAQPLASLKTSSPKPLAALAGIAQPEVFFAMLQREGLALRHTVPLPDHATVDAYLAAMDDAHHWVVTEKDATKLRPLDEALTQRGIRYTAVPLVQTFSTEFWEAWDEWIRQRVTP